MFKHLGDQPAVSFSHSHQYYCTMYTHWMVWSWS